MSEIKEMNEIYEEYTSCELCPRKCRTDRRTSVGYCREKDTPRAARAALHMWEEPCISGEEGSGTVFFCGCTLGCVYCQNSRISDGGDAGKPVTTERLAEIYLELQAKKANNINLVTPTMFSPHVIASVRLARENGLTLPVVYNTSGYETAERIRALRGTVDIWLPDFKYPDPDTSARYSAARDYPEVAKTALREMVSMTGKAEFDPRGIMKKGIIVRHLLLPGKLAESKKVVEYLFSEYGNDITYSLMSQYTPMRTLDREKYPELARRVTTYEYTKLIDHALSLGITNAFMQDGRPASESFIPEFSLEGI